MHIDGSLSSERDNCICWYALESPLWTKCMKHRLVQINKYYFNKKKKKERYYKNKVQVSEANIWITVKSQYTRLHLVVWWT